MAINVGIDDDEEADTLHILYTSEIDNRVPFCECVIFSQSTDVCLHAVYFYDFLLTVTRLWTSKGDALKMESTKKRAPNIPLFYKDSIPLLLETKCEEGLMENDKMHVADFS